MRGRPFPLPIVKGTIGGVEIPMLVDTGATTHVVAGWFARRLGFPLRKLGDSGTDHVGNSIATYRVDHPEIAIEGWGKLDAPSALATDVPDAFEKLGIGAFISPQRLIEEGDAVLFDLEKGTLRSAWWEEAAGELGASERAELPVDARACEESGPIKGLSFVLPAKVEDEAVDLLVDTGAQTSDLFTHGAAAQKLAGRTVGSKEPMYTASGKIAGRKIAGATITAGSVSVKTDIDVMPGASERSCPRDGVIAMDVLRACTLLFGRDKMLGRCTPTRR